MSIEVGEGADFEYNVEDAESWSEEDADRIVKYLFDRGGDVEGSENFDLIQKINEARGVEVGGFNYASSTVEQVKEHVGDDGDRAQEAYAAETSKDKPRQSLVDWLEEHFEVE